jgi:hypothetical protein
VTFVNCSFIESQSTVQGSAIDIAASDIKILDSLFDGGKCTSQNTGRDINECRGGAIACSSSKIAPFGLQPSTIMIQGGITSNHRVNDAGMFYIEGSCYLTIINHTGINNFAIRYGGIGVGTHLSRTDGYVIHNSIFINNRGLFGGVIAGKNIVRFTRFVLPSLPFSSSLSFLSLTHILVVSIVIAVRAPFQFFNCTFEGNNAEVMAAVAVTDGIYQVDPSLLRSDGNIFRNNQSPFGNDDELVSPPVSLQLVGNTSDVGQTSDSIVKPTLRVQMFDTFHRLVTIGSAYAASFGSATITSWADGNVNTTSEPSGVLTTPLNDTPEGNYSYMFPSLTISALPGRTYTYTVALQVGWIMPFSDGREVKLTRNFRLTMRPCGLGEYTTKTACLPCSPVSLLSQCMCGSV